MQEINEIKQELDKIEKEIEKAKRVVAEQEGERKQLYRILLEQSQEETIEGAKKKVENNNKLKQEIKVQILEKYNQLKSTLRDE